MNKIYINDTYEIKAIDFTDDTSLVEIEINREEVFGDMTDFMILNYCYKQDKTGYSIYPASNYSKLVEEDYKIKIDETQKKVSILETENKILKEELFLMKNSLNQLLFVVTEGKHE